MALFLKTLEETTFLLLIVVFFIEFTDSKTILQNTAKTEPQPVALDFKNHSQYSSSSK